MKSMLKIKNFYNRSQTNGIDDLQYILRHNKSQTSTSNSKYYQNRTFFHSSICLYTSRTVPHISQPIKSHEWRWNPCWKSKTFIITHRQMVYITYNISYETFQAKHRPLTPNIIQTAPFFTHPYAFTPHTQYHSLIGNIL